MSSYRGFVRRRLIAVFAGLLVGVLGIILAACGTGPTGPQGTPGANALVSTSPEQPGANCPNGGTKIQTGLDANGNGVLDPSEVNAQATTYVCNGAANGGHASLVSTTPEPNGTNCEFGGVRVDSGVDDNDDGKLDTSEIDDTTYMCNTAPSGTLSVTNGVVINVKSGGVSTNTTGPITVRFTVKDSNGYPVDLNGVYSINQPIQPTFVLAYYTKDTNGNVTPFKVLTQTAKAAADGGSPLFQPSWYSPLGTNPGQGTLAENGTGAGDYTYSFPTATTQPSGSLQGALGVAYDSSKLSENHVVWVIAQRQTDMVYPTNGKTTYTANYPYYFIPAGGTATARELVLATNCWKCHDNFRLEVNTSDEFVQHGGKMMNGTLCNVCHNPDRVSNPAANSKVYIHRIHGADHIQPANWFHGIEATFPQDIRNCDVCHKDALQGQQSLTNPSRQACGSCHDYVDFTGQVGLPTCSANGVVLGDAGLPIPCGHVGGAQSDDTQCTLCHKTTTHLHYAKDTPAAWPVEPPDPNNSKLVDGGNANTNAGYLAQGGWVPPGAAQINYVLKSVQTWTDSSSIVRPSITFKLQMTAYGSDAGATDIVFNAPSDAGIVELMPNFVGSPSVYFAFAVPEDGINAPADFNASGSVWIKDALNGKALTGTLSGPDTNGYYTINATNIVIPSNATMLTGGVGYTYSLSSTQPLTETDLNQFPYTASTSQGGLVMNAPNVSMAAKGFTARRAIIDNNQCKDCHGVLGVRPTFHAGQRNDGATCAFCHNPNRTSSGWAASSKYYIHAIHGARNRTVPFTWDATSSTKGFYETEFPSPLNDCKTCHLPNTYDFTAPASLAAVPNMPLTAVGTGIYNPAASNAYTISPYVVADNVTSYGSGFSFSASTGVATQGASTNLVITQITTACSACHDAPTDIAHMQANGGHFYDTRANALSAPGEQCLICHGPGRVAAIGEVHLQ